MIVLGLGSNRGDRLAYLHKAKQALSAFVTSLTCSTLYESPAMLPENAPTDWESDFYNMAIAGETKLTPQELLVAVKQIEQQLGRQDRGRWGPREIDIDILAYDELRLQSPDLIIPHIGLLQRDFALVPFADVAPHWIHPGQHKAAAELAKPMRAMLVKSEHAIG